MSRWNPVEAWRQALHLLIAGEYDRLPVTSACEITEPGVGLHVGWDEEQRQRVRDYIAAFSDYEITFTRSMTERNRCAVQVQYEMTHTGPLEGPDGVIPATGKRIKVSGAYFVTFDREGEGALICEIHQYFDSMEPFQQLGIA